MDTSIIAGRNSVTEALKAGRSVTKIYMTAKKEAPPLARIRTLAKERKISVEFVDTRSMERLAQGVRHQDVIAIAAAVDFADLDDVLAKVQEKGEMPFLVHADGIEDVHNFGAIIRTAECAGVHAVLVPQRHSAPINETVAKTSAGAVE